MFRRTKCGFGPPVDVRPNVGRPARDRSFEALAVASIQRSVRLLEAREISRNRRDEAVDRVLRIARSIAVAVGDARRVDQSPQRRGRPATLALQPLPVTRQQRDLAPDDSELGAAPPSRARSAGLRLWQLCPKPRGDVLDRPAEIEVELATARVVEDQDQSRIACFDELSERDGKLPDLARGDADVPSKSAEGVFPGAGLSHDGRILPW